MYHWGCVTSDSVTLTLRVASCSLGCLDQCDTGPVTVGIVMPSSAHELPCSTLGPEPLDPLLHQALSGFLASLIWPGYFPGGGKHLLICSQPLCCHHTPDLAGTCCWRGRDSRTPVCSALGRGPGQVGLGTRGSCPLNSSRARDLGAFPRERRRKKDRCSNSCFILLIDCK